MCDVSMMHLVAMACAAASALGQLALGGDSVCCGDAVYTVVTVAFIPLSSPSQDTQDATNKHQPY